MGLISGFAANRIKSKLNNLVYHFGKVIDVNINTDKKNIRIDLALDGETEIITITVYNYKTMFEDNYHYIKFDKIFISKKWMQKLVEKVIIPKFAPGNKYKITSTHSFLIDLFL